MNSHPVIGITSYRQSATWSSWEAVPADLAPSAYAESVSAAGGVAVLIPPLGSALAARSVLARLDGLIIAGGADLNPALYGQEPAEDVTTWYDDRDASELLLLDAADELSLPTLGICRGMQIMAVRVGGTLVQHLPEVVGHDDHSPAADEYHLNDVSVAPGHHISALIDARLRVPCHHHQAVLLHPGFIETARSDDGTIEAMESEGDRFCVAVQWHPETAADKGLFAGLIDAARASADARLTDV